MALRGSLSNHSDAFTPNAAKNAKRRWLIFLSRAPGAITALPGRDGRSGRWAVGRGGVVNGGRLVAKAITSAVSFKCGA